MEAKKAFGQSRYDWIALSDLRIHPRIQRELDKARVEALVKKWQPTLCRPLCVVPNGKCYLVFDGQTRLEAARQIYAEDQTLPCQVFENLSEKEEAERFLGLNDTKAVHIIDKWKVRRIANDPLVLEVDEILTQRNLTAADTVSHGDVRAVHALEWIYTRTNGKDLLERTLDTIQAAWGNTPDAYDGVMLRGMSIAINRCGVSIKLYELSARLAKTGTPGSMIGNARTLAKISSISVARAVAETIIGIWNKGRKESLHLKL